MKIIHPWQRRAATNIYQKFHFFYNRPCAARHIAVMICGKGNGPTLFGFYLGLVKFDSASLKVRFVTGRWAVIVYRGRKCILKGNSVG